MRRQKSLFPERTILEAHIGNSDVIPRPAQLERGVWDSAVQAEVIISRLTCSLREASSMFICEDDQGALLEFNKSALGHPLREPSNHATLLAAAKDLAGQAGINTDDITIHKKHGPLSAIFGPDIYIVLPDEDSARQLLDHVQLPKLEPVGNF